MTPYDPAIISSSTSVVGQGISYLYNTVWSFLPLFLTVVIPLGLLYTGYRMLKSKAKIK